jgi:hypothetical protein
VFKQDHRADFDAVLAAKRPFSLVRFGDGELAIMQGREHKSADVWATRGPVWCKDELIASLSAKLDGYCVGLPSACCLSRGLQLRSLVNVPLHAQTFATLFMHGNLPRVRLLFERFEDPVVVHHRHGEIHVPADGVTSPFDVDAVVDKLLEVKGKAIFLAAGPISNLIAYRYWLRQTPRDRVTMLDIGSALDVFHGDNNRYYHGQMNDHRCSWYEADRPIERTRMKIKDVGPQVEPNRLGQERTRVFIESPRYGMGKADAKTRIATREVTRAEELSIQKKQSTQGRTATRLGGRSTIRIGRR